MKAGRARVLGVIGVVNLAVSAAGCAALPKGSIPVKAELTTFKDIRPTVEREALRNVSGVASGGEEASNGFRVVMDDLQSAILQDRTRIIDAVRSESAQ